MTLQLVRAFRFHYEHDGYIVGQRAACALRMARAEIAAGELDWTFEWEWEQDVDLSWMSERERDQEHEVLCCLLKDASGEVLASLSNIVDADSAYRRVIEAELALEADTVDVLAALGDEVVPGIVAAEVA